MFNFISYQTHSNYLNILACHTVNSKSERKKKDIRGFSLLCVLALTLEQVHYEVNINQGLGA